MKKQNVKMQNEGEVFLDHGFHFPMEVLDGKTVFACNICHEMFETSEIVQKHITKKHHNELKDFEKEYEHGGEPEDTDAST